MAIARYLIDKSAHARLGVPAVAEVVQPLLERGLLATCGIAALDLLFSARSTADHDRLNLMIDTIFEWLPTEDVDCRRAREVCRRLASSGRHRAVGIPDLVTAAVAERHRVAVLHYDADYDLIAEITGQPTEWVVPRGSVN
jgi:predicted nucleic acid-binding protein